MISDAEARQLEIDVQEILERDIEVKYSRLVDEMRAKECTMNGEWEEMSGARVASIGPGLDDDYKKSARRQADALLMNSGGMTPDASQEVCKRATGLDDKQFQPSGLSETEKEERGHCDDNLKIRAEEASVQSQSFADDASRCMVHSANGRVMKREVQGAVGGALCILKLLLASSAVAERIFEFRQPTRTQGEARKWAKRSVFRARLEQDGGVADVGGELGGQRFPSLASWAKACKVQGTGMFCSNIRLQAELLRRLAKLQSMGK